MKFATHVSHNCTSADAMSTMASHNSTFVKGLVPTCHLAAKVCASKVCAPRPKI